MGKLIVQTEGEITPNVEIFDYYTFNMKAFLSVKI